jgi:ABC-type taurine transport system ATPase subunit
VEEILRLLDLQDKAECLPRELSTGGAKLAGLARALRGEPKLLLLDKPAAGLDSHESRELGRRLLSLLDLGISMVLVDHDLELVMGVAISKRLLDEPSSRSTLSTWPPASSTTTVSGFSPRSFPAARTPAVTVLAVSRLMFTCRLSLGHAASPAAQPAPA